MKLKSSIRSLAVLSALGAVLVIAGVANAATATLFGSTGNLTPSDGAIAIDSSGSIFAGVSENMTKSIAKVTADGTVTAQWTNALPDYSYGVAFGPGGTVFSGQYATVVKLDASGALLNTYNTSGASGVIAANATTGDVYWLQTQGNNKIGRIPAGTSSGNAPSPVAMPNSDAPCAVITDASGNVYVGTSTAGKVHKFDASLNAVTSYSVGQKACGLAVDGTYLYVANENSSTVSRVKLSDGNVEASWSNLGSLRPRFIAVDSTGSAYTVNVPMGMGANTISKITSTGTSSELFSAGQNIQLKGIVTDAATNVYFTQGAFMTPNTAGIYKIAQAAPAPAPSNATTNPATPAASSTPTPGPALKVADIPKEITVEITPSANGSTQEITAEVPCTAPEGQLLERCAVKMTAPAAVMLGQGDGINVRADKKVTIGQASVTGKGKKVIVVKVKINKNGRKALKYNTKIKATIGLTAVTVSNQSSTGETSSEMRLPTQLLSPTSGIFSSNSTTLNAAGVQFVKRLAELLPKHPKQMTFIGFADNTGVPGDNRWLGDRRAKAVRAALEAKGIVAVKSDIESKAARSPRDDNSKQSGRERNRRVSIRITY